MLQHSLIIKKNSNLYMSFNEQKDSEPTAVASVATTKAPTGFAHTSDGCDMKSAECNDNITACEGTSTSEGEITECDDSVIEHLTQKQHTSSTILMQLPLSVKRKGADATTLALNTFPALRENLNSVFNEEFVALLSHPALNQYGAFCFDTLNTLTTEQKKRKTCKPYTPLRHEIGTDIVNLRSNVTSTLNAIRTLDIKHTNSHSRLILKNALQELQTQQICSSQILLKLTTLENGRVQINSDYSARTKRVQTKTLALHLIVPGDIPLQHRYYAIDSCTIDVKTENPLIAIFEEMVAFLPYTNRLTLTERLHHILCCIRDTTLTEQQHDEIRTLTQVQPYGNVCDIKNSKPIG